MNSFEENKQKMLDMLKARKLGVKAVKPAVPSRSAIQIRKSAKKPVQQAEMSVPAAKFKSGFYSASKTLSNTIGRNIGSTADVVKFENNQKMIDWAESNQPEFIIVDIDPPTDWKLSMDIFTNLSMLSPETKFIVMAHEPGGSVAQQMLKKGAFAVISKPVNLNELSKLMKQPS